jgi:hypothetical protein
VSGTKPLKKQQNLELHKKLHLNILYTVSKDSNLSHSSKAKKLKKKGRTPKPHFVLVSRLRKPTSGI